MAKKKRKTRHAEIVRRFAERLRERRHALGMTQEALASAARITVSYVWRLENGGGTPGIDRVERLATALGTTIADLLPTSPPPDSLMLLRDQARRQFDVLMQNADREFLVMLNPLLFRLVESLTRGVKPSP